MSRLRDRIASVSPAAEEPVFGSGVESAGLGETTATRRVSIGSAGTRLAAIAAALSAIVAGLVLPASDASASPVASGGGKTQRYNILFVILDDVGADQFRLTNPQGIGLPSTPTCDAIAAQGVNFTNFWAMPECSPSRTCFFTGRFPMRTNVGSPLTPATLAQSQCSPFEITTPRILEPAGYRTALFGKFHLGQNENNPAGFGVAASLGFGHFDGTMLGAPPFVDPTVFGQVETEGGRGGLSCGYPTLAGGGPATGACGFEDGDCVLGLDAVDCLAVGGIPLVSRDGSVVSECGEFDPRAIEWCNMNGYYAWPRTINIDGVVIPPTSDACGGANAPDRVFCDGQQAALATEFIASARADGVPWMCTLSFNGDHDPWQMPPSQFLPSGSGWPDGLTMDCESLETQRILSNLIIESMDFQIRRVLLDTGLAQMKKGQLEITAPDTVIVVVGDNGSFLNTVRLPFNPLRSKATCWQTGVLAPMVVAGGPTSSPGRSVDEMVNCVDLFSLWGELAGIDVRDEVPPARVLDAAPLLPYLADPSAPSQREHNFSEYLAPTLDSICYPCLIAAGPGVEICTDTILSSQMLCETQGGVWYGPGSDFCQDGDCPTDCCELKDLGVEFSKVVFANQRTITDGRWKLVQNDIEACDTSDCEFELYDLSDCPFAAQLFGRGIDNNGPTGCNKMGPECSRPTEPEALKAYLRLRAELEALRASAVPCVGDIDLDGEVGASDLSAMLGWWGGSSTADLNNDGITDGADLPLLLGNWGVCAP
jgi:hypothetical protein